jgi:histidine triad (HIT) family protein
MSDTIFMKIIRREIPAQIVHEDDHCLAFRDVNPQAPTHVLVIPKEPLAGLSDAGPEHGAMLGRLLLAARDVAEKLELNDGYRLVINNGAAAGQTVFHLHVHLLAGRHFTWPPG